jgi:penicillin-binding protein 1C
MSQKFSAGPPAGSSGSPRRRLRLRALALLLFPLLSAAALRLPYAPLQAHRGSLAGVRLTDRHGRLLAAIPGAQGAFTLRLGRGEIPPEVGRIFVRLEDRRFFRHRGIDPRALARAARDNLRSGGVVSGASTISMQLARLLDPHGGGWRGKLRESLAALRLEALLDKQEILRLYLNLLPFGRNTVGVGAAALAYFDRPLQELSPAQVLLLATLPRSPSLLDPFPNPGALGDAAAALSPRVGIPAAEVRLALTTLRRGRPVRLAPHFVLYVENELPRLAALRAAGRQIVRVTTTLDLGLFQSAAGRLAHELAGAAAAGQPALRDAAAVVLDNGGGEILAYVGAPGAQPAGPHGAIDAARVRNPSGSTLKPFLYALALERGWTCASLLPDLSLSFGGRESYRPENFDRRSRGLVRLRSALAGSLNVPAVYLLSRLGLPDFLRVLSRLELDPGPAGGLGLGAAIGNAPVSLLAITRAFSVFPRGGLLPPLSAVRALVTAEGLSIPTAPPSGPRVFSRESAWLIGSVLSDPSARATGFGTRSRLNASFPAMFKSGTASGYFSLWCLGATPAYTVGVWAGSLDRRPVPGATGSSVPATVARALLEELQERPGQPVDRSSASASASAPLGPVGLAAAGICALTGFLASPACPAVREELFRQDTLPWRVCPVHGAGQGLEALALELFLEGGSGPRILYPRDGATFYRDGPEAAQGIPVWIAARREENLEVRLNGESRRLGHPFRLELPVRPGAWSLEVIGEAGRDAVRYQIR